MNSLITKFTTNTDTGDKASTKDLGVNECKDSKVNGYTKYKQQGTKVSKTVYRSVAMEVRKKIPKSY